MSVFPFKPKAIHLGRGADEGVLHSDYGLWPSMQFMNCLTDRWRDVPELRVAAVEDGGDMAVEKPRRVS